MITKEQALTVTHLHFGECIRVIGPRGGVRTNVVEVRRNGATQTWKTRPNEWRMPVKYGIQARDQFSIRHSDAEGYHVPADCPLNDPQYVTTEKRIQR